jgi:Flp pilus assembly protein TadG
MNGVNRVHSLLSRIRARLAQERGSTIVFFAMMLPVLLLCVALAVDLGMLETARQQAQNAADAGALAGATDNVNGAVVPATAATDAASYVQSNDRGAAASVTAPFDSDPSAVKVVVSQQVPFIFGRAFKFLNASVSATAVATNTIGTPLEYFGGNDSDLEDGSATPDGWVNFCAGTQLPNPPFKPDTESNSASNTDDPARCPASAAPANESLDGWDLVHGGIDISRDNFGSPPGTTDQMVDLTGTCVETIGNFPSPQSGHTSINLNGTTTNDEGYCQNNADGEIEEKLPTRAGVQYTVGFWLGSNTWGYPNEKSLMVMASTTEASNLPPMADTAGNAANSYVTTYPLEGDARWPSYSGQIIAHQEIFYVGPSGGAPAPNWVQRQFSFIAAGTTTYLTFGGLTNCSADWASSSSLNHGSFYTTLSAGDPANSPSTTGWVQPPPEVHDDVQDDPQNQYYDQCKYGAGISDVTITGAGAVALTQ